MRSFEKIKEYLQGTAARRAIASVLVAAECLSVVAVGVPAVYAEAPVTLESVELSDRTANAAPEQETVTPAEAARLGAEAAESFADEAERAAEEAEQAADETDRILEQALTDAVLNAARESAGQADDAARRALDAAENAADEADWAAQAVEIAAQEAGRTAEEAQRAAEEAERAAETAEETAEAARMLEEAARAAEESNRELEGSAQLQEAAEERSAKREEAKDKIALSTPMPTPANEAAAITDKIEKPADAMNPTADPAQNDEEQTDAEAPARMTEAAVEAGENAETKAAEAEQARAYAAAMADEYDRSYSAALRAGEQANRAFAASDRAAQAAERARAAVAQAEEQLAQMPQTEPAEALTEEPTEEAPTEAPTGEQTEAQTEEQAQEPAYEQVDYSDSAVTVWGEVPVGVYVQTEDVTARYQGFDPREARTLAAGETNAFLSDGTGAEKRYRVLTAYDISLTRDGEEYQPEPGSPLTVSITDPAIEEGMALEIWHIHDDGFTEPITDFTVEGSSVRFTAESFSVYLVCSYTVDFHWGDYTYSIEGESEITLSELFEKLGVTEISLDNVAAVSFSNPEYIAIEQTGSDWLLRSLAPFQTEEALTLTLNNGQNVEIKVTDADGEPQPEEQPAPVIVAVPAAVRNLVYDDTAHELITAGTVENGTMVYSLNEDGEYREEIPTAVDAGDYTVYFKVDGQEQPADSLTARIEKTQAEVTVTITGHSGEADYDGKEHTVTGYDVSISNLLYTENDFTFSGTASVSGTNAGSYGMGLTAGNFENISGNFANVSFEIVDGTLTIKPIDVTVTITGHSDEADYDGTAHTVSSYDVSSKDGVYTENDFTFSGNASVSGTSAGSYGMGLKAEDFKNTSDNFVNVSFVVEDGTLTIKPIDVTVTITEHSDETVYDGTEHTVTDYDVSISNPLYTEADFTFSGNASVSGTNAGRYDMELTAEDFANTNPNFAPASFVIEDGALVISPRPVTVTADDASKTYGDPDPEELTATEEGLLEGDTIKYTVTRAEGENAGDYAITVSQEAEPDNYTISCINGVFTITKRELILTAASETKVYDGYELSNDGYTVSSEAPSRGLVEGHTIRSIIVEGAQTDANASTAEEEITPNNMIRDAEIIDASGTDVTENYAVNYVGGALKVVKKPITITAESAEKVYDGTALTAEGYTTTGLADGDVLDSVTITGSQTVVGKSDNVPSNAKIVRPAPTQDDPNHVDDVNGNYDITYVNGALKVTAQTLTITADSAEKVYDGTALTKNSYTAEGLAEGDSIETVTITGSQTNAGQSENVPSEAKIVNAAGEDISEYYKITYVNGNLEVTRKPVKLTAASSVQVYTGTEKTIGGFTVSADGRPLSGVTFADSVSASGSGTEAGSYPVTFTGVNLNETTDTTGNYIVAETEKGTLQIVQSAPIKKALTDFNGNEASYEITVNPNGLTLNGGSGLTLKDTFTNNQSIEYSSVEVSPNVPYDYSGFTGTFTIPDSTPVTITYKTRVAGTAGTEATFGNTAELGVTQNGSFAPWSDATVDATRTITPTGTDIEGADGVYTIKLFTYAQDHMENGLGGAVFRLLDANQRPIAYRAGDHAGEIVTYTTGSDGYVNVELDDGIVSLHKNTIYYLEMITAPVAHHADGSYTYYQKDNTLYSFLITDDPGYSAGGAAYTYFNGDVLKVRCYPEAQGINVTKRFSGNYNLTDAQKNQIRFVLQKEDLATGGWVDVEAHTYAEFSYGSMNFNAGRAGGPPLEQAVLYRLIEQNSAVEGADLTSTVTLSYQRDNEPVQENTNEFEVNPDHSTYSFSLIFDNAYVDHKLTVVKLNELTGELLTGAEFKVYKALDNSFVRTYLTEGEGVLEIRFDDEGANYTADTAYYVVETAPPEGYLMPVNPEKIYFYFSGNSSGTPAGILAGTTAVDLTASYDAVVIANHTETVTVPVTVAWAVDGRTSWPADVESVNISLYRAVNGGEPKAVLKEGSPMTVTLNAGKNYDNTTFVNLPARDESGNDYTYSVLQNNDLPGYYTSYKVSGTGWYVVRNESAVSVTVTKEWYDLEHNRVTETDDRQAVAFDLYRTTVDHPEFTTRDELTNLLRGSEPVRTNLPLRAPDWSNTVTSLQKQDANGDPYYYFALEREDSMPRNNEDRYAVVPAAGAGLRTLTIKNTQTPITVIIRAGDLTKAYSQGDPPFIFTAEVQDDACSIGAPVLGEDGKYTVTVTKGTETTDITFTCSREEGEDVGSYAIELEGDASQGGYRVRLDDGTLTITPAQVTVKGTATKVYGDPDPSLVEITGVKKGDSIACYAYREIGEQKGSYRITVTGLTKQGNYEITYINDSLTIEPAPVTVTADSVSKAYGTADPILTVTMDGLKNQDAMSVIKYNISRAEGESVGEYPVTVIGDEEQGNYTVTFVGNTFTITGQKVTVRAKNLMKTYGEADPTWDAEVTGLNEGDTIAYTFTRAEGEDVGTYVITPTGETAQGNYEVSYETGILTINKKNLTVTPVNLIKALTDPITPDPPLTVKFDGLAERDGNLVETAVYEAGTWTYTYTREGKDVPEFGFTLTRTPGETAGPYIIAATAYGERAKNYNITYKTGIFTILTTYNVVVTQQTRDLVDYTQNPAYSYTAVLDLSGIGIENYTAEGFENNSMAFTLPADGASSKTLSVPSGAKLTVTQTTSDPDYTTSVTLDSKAVEGTSVEINPVNKAASIAVTHERITLPVEARAAQRQTPEGKADEDGAVAVTPLAYLGIPRDEGKNPIPQSAEDFIRELDSQGVFNLPEDMYYVPEHASVYNGNTVVATNVQAICYDAENKVWQYSLNGTDFAAFAEGDQLELFYMPKYICRVQADGEQFYTLKEALAHIGSDTGTIEMLIDRYTMPSADALTIPKNCNITLTTANGVETATILRKPSFNTGHMFSNSGTLTFERITLDGNGSRVTAGDAMVLNSGTLTVSGTATLQNAAGNNGGAIYANGGSVTVEAGASITGNRATNGGAIYAASGSLAIATENISGNTAVNGGAVYSSETDKTLTLTGTLGNNNATNGGAVYMAGGRLKQEDGGAITGNYATSGGAVFMTGGTLDLTGGSISSNNATNGGAFYLTGGTMNLSGSTVSDNTAAETGGAVYSSNATLSITGGAITGNSATNGGAILLASGTASVGGAAVKGNSASGFGGAVCQMGGTMTVTGTIDGANSAENGSAVYVQNGSATFNGCNITGNTATAGGAVGIGSVEARLHFAGNAKITGNTWNGGKSNLYLDQDSDLVINTAGLGGSANIGVRVKDDLLSTRGDVACKFGTYTGESNLSKFKNDVNTGLTACANNYKIIWSKSISVQVVRQNTYSAANSFPPAVAGTGITSFTYNPKSQTNNIYDLVMEMYSAVYKSSITANDLYAYSFASTATNFEQFLSEINWNSEEQKWDFVERSGNTTTGTPGLKIYYSQGAYISIVNNSSYDMTVDSMTVLGKNVPFYGYPTVKNNITLETLTPVTAEDLVLKSGENIKLLFPGAVNKNWTLTGTFVDPTTHEPVSNAPYKYTLDRTHGGQEMDGAADANGSFTHSGKTNNTVGGSYEILFGDPTYICKVTDGGVEHPFPTLNAAWNYIVDNDLTYDGTTPGGTIEMLIDYLQPASDVLNINEASFTNRGKTYSGYCLKLTTAATSGVQYPYVGQTGVTRATISRDSDNGGAAVIAMPYKATKACTEGECDAFLIVDNLTFDGKALAKTGNGGAISTANNVVTITRCDFKGYQAVRGGAVFVAWGALTVGGDDPNERCTFSNCSTGASSGDKIGGGGIWTSAQNLVVKNADFDTCACIVGNSQGGGIFHNIRQNGKSIFEGTGSGDYATFPTGYSLTTTTLIEGCNFYNCYSAAGSGGTIECDSMVVTIKGSLFDGSYSNKSNANGGAVNILHNDAFGASTIYPNASLTVIDTTFRNCQTNTGTSYGGAICDQNSVKTEIINCDFINCSANKGGAIVTNREKKIPTDMKPGVIPDGLIVNILGSRFENCTARAEGGAVHTTTTKLTISDTYEDENGQNVTADAWFKDCSAPSYGGVYQDGIVTGSEVTVSNVYFDSCSSNTGNAGALMVNAQTLSITGTARENEKDPYTFTACTAGSSGGAVYHSPKTTVKDTLTNVSFYNCSAKAEGGGARLASKAIEISGAEVRNCEAVTNGGGLYVQGTTTVENSVFSGNKASGETGFGGSLYINSGTVGITGGSISDSIAVNGGGIYNKGTLTISKGSEENSGTITNCVARTSGGGIYSTGALTLTNAVISDCYAVTSGGGIYHTGELKPYGKITKCYAEKGGGVYSANGKLTISDTAKSMEISDCHAATVTIADDGTATTEKEYKPENQGGGIYRSATNNDGTISAENAVIMGCSAYDGGGLYYNSSKKLTFSAGNFYGNTATNNGGAIYTNADTITMSGGVIGGSEENANHAQLGAGIFVADGHKITIGGGRITHNEAAVGGAVAVGGSNANTQLLFQGAPIIMNNTMGDDRIRCNVYLNYNTNSIIRTSNTALSGTAYIGVYVASEQFDQHGNYEMNFGTFANGNNLSAFYNDRIYAGGMMGVDHNIKWSEFVCKITDGVGNLLYIDEACEAPAIYMKLENEGTENTTSAFGMLSYASPKLYNADGPYTGAYQIQMLVGDYSCTSQIKLKNGSKDITLTTASRTADECGFKYTGAADQALVRRAATYGSMIDTSKMSKLTIENITIDGGSVNGFKSTSNGGILFITNGTKVYLNENATLCNSELNKGYNGGGVRMQDGSLSYLYINGAEIRNCVARDNNNNSGYGGAISAKNGSITMNSGLITECTSEGGGGAVVVDQNMSMYMNGGTITGNNATKYGGGIELKGKIYFTGNPVISGNTLNGSTPCNLQLMNNDSTSIYTDTNGLGPFAEIRVYTDSEEGKTNQAIYKDRGGEGDPFGTWKNNANLHCFINDRNVNLRGMKTVDDKLIYWRESAFLSVGKAVESDWAADRAVEFDFTVTLSDKTFSGSYENMTFVNGVATFKLKAGEVRTAIGLPFEFIHNGINYTVTENLPEGQTVYTTAYSHNGGASVEGTTVTGHFGENMSEDPLTSSSVSGVMFTNTRATDDLTVSKTVTEGITGDYTIPFSFTVTLDDNTITKTYNAKRYQDQTDTTGTDATVSFTNGVGTFQLTHGQSLKLLGLPTELGFKVEENLTQEQYSDFRTFVTVGSADEILSYSASGKIGELTQVAFRNNRYGLVCKIVTSQDRQQLYYRANNDPNVDRTPAIFDELEKAFETINSDIVFFTDDGSTVSVKDNMVRVEMVKPHYEMNRQATLANGYNVTLGTAQKTDRLFPYPSDAEMPAVVTRGFDGGSMIVDNGNLTIDDITLDGGSAGFTASEKGGIVQVSGAQTLKVTNNATLRNSKSTDNGGAIWLSKNAALDMNGTITACEAKNGGGVYAEDGFGGGATGTAGISIGGTISGCTAGTGNGGALHAGTSPLNGAALILTGTATLSGNSVPAVDGGEDSGRGGAIYCAAAMEIDSADVTISGNTAGEHGGGIYLDSNASLSMTGGTISGNTAVTGNAGGIWANSINITGGTFSGNKATEPTNGKGGAIYTKTSTEVSISGASFEDNEAYQGGAVYHQAKSFTVTNVTMTGNTAIKNGGAVYAASIATNTDASVKTGPFDMIGGTISGNSSPEGAISTGGGAVLNFSGDASVNGNTNGDTGAPVFMNVFLGYHSNTIINASDLTGTGLIGVYVKDGDEKIIYHNHGIANRPFGTGTGENLNKFVNDRDNTLTGVQGPDGLIMWPGKDLLIQVCQNKENEAGEKIIPVGGARFSLTNENDETIWTGESNPASSLSPGLITIPWGILEADNKATFTKKGEDGYVSAVTYYLSELQANSDTVRPADTWELTIGTDNAVTWKVILATPTDATPTDVRRVNRTLDVEPKSGTYPDETFVLYNDVKPTITFDPNGGILSGKEDISTRTVTVAFGPEELNHTYTITEPNPTRESSVFRIWSTVKNPSEGDGHMEYKQGDEILFYRDSDDDDLTLYALWSTVVCKITDTNDNLLYVNGSPAVYMSLKEGFDAFNEASFTLRDGATTARPRKLKMLVPDYEMTETVELARGKTCEFMTAPSTDKDGYAGPENTCVITRAKTFDSGSMIIDNYTLAIRNLILDGSVKDDSGAEKAIDGGIIRVTGNASHLTIAQNAVLRNAAASGNGGAIRADENTIVTISTGSAITNCRAANGGAIYADASTTVNLSGGTISGNKANSTTTTEDGEETVANGKGGAVYAAGKVNMTGGSVKDNEAETNGGGLYLAAEAALTVSGGSLTGNSAQNGGGVYSDGSAALESTRAAISGNTASANGGGVYVSDSGSFSITAGTIGADGSPNTAANGGGAYLAGKAVLTGGSISYNGTAGTGNGGGLYLNTEADITLSGTTLSHNQAANGGAIYAVSPLSSGETEEKTVTLTLAKGTISNNTASANGGGVYLAADVKLGMNGGTLDTNSAQNGGGVYAASGSGMTLTGGSVSRNTAKRGTDNTGGNGAGVYIAGDSKTSYGTLRVKSGSISGNNADSFGAAVYLQGYGQLHVSGGTISENTAGNANGGAINAEGTNARIYLSGKPTIFNNPANAATTAQKNLVLSVSQNTIINTEESGLDQKETNSTLLRAATNITGIVGVYVIDENDIYTNHGVYDKPFGTFGSTDDKRDNAKNLVNDRNLALHGVQKEDEDNIIYWLDVVCKVTNAGDEMLYQRVNVDDSGVYVYAPAVYTSLADGLAAISGNLYRKSGSRYATANTGAVKVKMLKDYTLGESEIIDYTTARNVTLTTAETSITTTMRNSDDHYVYIPAEGAEGEKQTKATLTRARTGNSMFKVNTPRNSFDVSNLIIDGDNRRVDVDGGAFNIQAVYSSAFSGVTLQNHNVTGSGGAIWLDSGSLTLKDSTVNGNTAANGAGIYLTENASLSLSGDLNFGGTDRKGGDGDDKDDLKGTDGNFVRKDADFKTDADKEPTNGGKQYPTDNGYYLVRQDIYITGTATPHTAIRVTGNITSGDGTPGTGTIWVWADGGDEEQNHYEMLKQFAVFYGAGRSLSDDSKDSSMKAFRNARPDSLTNCGGDYLTGQKGDAVNGWECIYWTGGFDVVFLKIDAYGGWKKDANGKDIPIGLPGATFTLYTDETCTTPYVMTFTSGDNVTSKSASSTSSNGTATYRDKNGASVTLLPGEVLLPKVPPKTFYMKETGKPTEDPSGKTFAYRNNDTVYELRISDKGVLTMWTKDEAGQYTMEVYKVMTKAAAGDNPAEYQYRVMNVSMAERKVILRKVSDSYTSLQGAEFRIFRYDGTPVSSGTDSSGRPITTFVSAANGVYFIDKLSYGAYYLYEEKAPDGYTSGKWFTLTVSDDNKSGASVAEIVDNETITRLNADFIKP